MRHSAIPADWPVQPIHPESTIVQGMAYCGHCELWWDDNKVTSLTPAFGARCPFEPFHLYEQQPAPLNAIQEQMRYSIELTIARMITEHEDLDEAAKAASHEIIRTIMQPIVA